MTTTMELGTPPDEATSLAAGLARADAPWRRRYAKLVLLHDGSGLLVAGLAAVLLRFGSDGPGMVHGLSYYAVDVALVLAWLAALALGRCYESRFLGEGPDEYKRLGNASLKVFGLVVFAAFATKTQVARGFLLLFFPFGITALVTGRWLARQRLARARARGRAFHRVLVVGRAPRVAELVAQMERDTTHGFKVVGVCLAGGDRRAPRTLTVPADPARLLRGERRRGAPLTVPVLGAITDVRRAVEQVRVDTVAVASSPELTGEGLRRLSYDLEGSGIDLMVAPALLNVAGNRISIRPVAGVPLLHVEEPELAGSRKLLKGTFDRGLALMLVLLLLPVLLGLMTLVRLTSRGPALFRQTRAGRDGELFAVYKLRTMQVDAEARLHELLNRNEVQGGVLFKLKDDPRVTRVGRFLRKWSLDELPQLLNVLLGHMSMVGPRPPLPTEVDKYEGYARRRLLVKPGITGLWQVSGRSDLAWEDAVRLDLRYVEDWSLGLDLTIMARTLFAVVHSAGAY
jgi:exopolysaccharide biosynthesis polyprenyl glycosylphosphotransferase